MPFSARVAGELHFCAAPNFTGSDYYLKFFFKVLTGNCKCYLFSLHSTVITHVLAIVSLFDPNNVVISVILRQLLSLAVVLGGSSGLRRSRIYNTQQPCCLC